MIPESRVRAALKLLPRDGFLRTYVEAAAEVTDAPLVFHVGSGLAALSQSVDVDLTVRLGAALYGNIYVLNVGASGDARKSTSVNLAQELVMKAIPTAICEQPGSPEGLIDSLRNSNRQLVCYSEFGQFLAQSSASYQTPLRTVYTNLWDGVPIGRALKGGRSKPILQPRLSLLAGCTVSYLESHTEEHDWYGGFMGRFLTLIADRERSFEDPPSELPAEQWLIDKLQSLVTLPGELGPWVGLSEACREIRGRWHQKLEAVASSGVQSVASSGLSRILPQAYKVASLLSWDRGLPQRGREWTFHPADFQFALAVATWHAKSLRALADKIAPNIDMRDRRTVLRLLSLEGVPFRELVTNSRLLLPRVRMLLASLMSEEYVVRCQVNGAEAYQRTELSYSGEASSSLGTSSQESTSSQASVVAEPSLRIVFSEDE